MNLRMYLFSKRISVTEFSKVLGCSRVHLSAVINGQRTPSLMLAKAIELATNGEVKAESLMKTKEEKQ